MISGGFGAPDGVRFRIDDPLDRREHALAHAFIERAHVQLDDRFIGNDVFLRAGLQRADRDNGGVRRRRAHAKRSSAGGAPSPPP